jgi:hypothetical protein
MLSVQAEPTQITRTGARPYRPDPSAYDLILFKQPRLGVALDGLLDEIRYRKDLADFERNRSGIAAVILLAHSLGVVSVQDIDQTVAEGWHSIYRLYRSSLDCIVDYLGHEAGIIAGLEFEHGGFEPIRLSMEKQGDGYYLYLLTYPRFTQFDLLELEGNLRRIIYGCLHYIVREIGFGILADDIASASMMIYEEVDTYKQYRDKNPTFNREELAILMFNDGDNFFSDFAEDPEQVAERFELLESILDNTVESRIGTVPSMNEIRAAVIEWKRSGSETYHNAWVQFIKQTIKVWKSFRHFQKPLDGEAVLEGCDGEMNDVPLDYGHAIGIGCPWEDEVAESTYQDIYQADEVPMARIKLQPVAISKTAERLTMIARARGLIRMAEIIQFGDEGE